MNVLLNFYNGDADVMNCLFFTNVHCVSSSRKVQVGSGKILLIVCLANSLVKKVILRSIFSAV